jgi:DNA polymerase III epsilon subunit-like protein
VQDISEKDDFFKKMKTSSKPYLLVFDTETTGLPRDFSADPKISNAWPRMVQIGWVVYNKDGKLLDERKTLIRPEGYVIPPQSTYFHKIPHAKALAEGRPLMAVLRHFLHAAGKCSVLVAHNAEFDARVVAAECYRCKLPDILKDKTIRCTMKSTTHLCKLGECVRGQWKYPKLPELHQFLFQCPPTEKLHDALEDTRVAAKCYFELERKYKELLWVLCYKKKQYAQAQFKF